jgi:hypothetical protein
MKGVAGVIVLVAVTLGLSAWLGTEQADGSGLSGASMTRASERGRSAATVSSSRIVLGGRVRCTATVASKVRAGKDLNVRFALHNRSKHSVTVSLSVFDPWLVMRASDGTTYDSTALSAGFISIPPPRPVTIRPGATLRHSSGIVGVRWSGPLRVTPGCLGVELPVLRVRVKAPSPSPDESAAFDEVVAASGFLLDHCRPQTSGVAVDGQIDPPNGTALPMPARCSVSMTSEGTFWVAQILVVTPPDLAGVRVGLPYETLWEPYGSPGLSGTAPYEAIAWQLVVTRNGPTSVAAATVFATYDSTQSYPFWIGDGTAWQGETAPCGGGGLSGGDPQVNFIYDCPATTQ